MYDDKVLFTPGPLTTSKTVLKARLRNLGSRDYEFVQALREVREGILEVAGVSDSEYTAILMQGSGTFSVEAVMGTTIPPNREIMLIINGEYGERMREIATRSSVHYTPICCPENEVPDIGRIDRTLVENPNIVYVAVVHCETTTGIMNPIQEIGEVVKKHGKTYFVDSMSAFGGISFDYEACGIDYLASSSNKCIAGVPGFAFAICKKEELAKTKGWSRSLSLDLHDQWKGFEKNGQFRFTPPIQDILAFHQALKELKQEGGVKGREARYNKNQEVLLEGMRALGFQEYLAEEVQGPIITTFNSPQHPNWDFEEFYDGLRTKGMVIYPGKLTKADTFRIGTIGDIYPDDVEGLVRAVKDTLDEMEVELQ